MTGAVVSHKAIVQLATVVGMRMFTDVTFELRGEHYGARYTGALSPMDIENERIAFMRRHI